MPTIEEIVENLELEDLEKDVPVEPNTEPILSTVPPKAVKWICKQIAKGKGDLEIAVAANARLADMDLSNVNYPNPIKAKAHIARIRAARLRRLVQLQEPPQ